MACWTGFATVFMAASTAVLVAAAPLRAQSPATTPAAGSPPSPEIAGRYPIIPWPRHLEPGEGRYVVDERSRITLSHSDDAALARMGARLAGWIENAIGVAVPVLGEPVAEPEPLAIALVLEPRATEPRESEAYTLDITPSGVVLRATTHAGLRHGLQTLRQLLPAAAETAHARRPLRFRAELPAVHIDDAPRFAYRGLHLDVSRHFFPVAFIKRYLDLMALYKLNRFHWHLTDDQGWRIEIERYPRLTGVGAFRSETLVGHAGDVPVRYDGQRYGGFYTQSEVREVVRYAAELGIMIVPEIEMPGHSLAALAAYPELACTEGPFEVATGPGVFEDIYCPSEETFAFLEGVLTEVMALFPGEFIHIGGDEAPTTRWRESALAQEVMRREGLADERALQSWFIGRIERFLNAHGRRMIGWDEIAEGALGPTTAVMYWRDWLPEVPEEVAGRGHDLVMTPNSRLYLDHYQGDGQIEPLAIGGLATLDEVYAYEPVPDGFTAEQARRVLGAQGNVWTEYMKTPAKVEYMAFPRALALAEVVWSPAGARDLNGFRRRLGANLKRLDALDVNYRPPPGEEAADTVPHELDLGTPPRQEVPDASAPDPPSETTPFTFTAAGDYGFDDAAAATLELIRPAGADFHLALGDLSYSPTRPETDWCEFVTARVGEGFPFQLVAGNHEDDFGEDGHISRFAACLPDRIGVEGDYPAQYYFDHGGLARIIVVSPDLTIDGAHYFYGGGSEPYRWLADAIDGARRDGLRWVIVAMHKNCISMGAYYCNIYQELFDLLIERRVDLVLHAHEHSYQRSRQLATGPACARVRVDDFDAACVAGEGSDDTYRRGAGTVFAIVGSAGDLLYELDEGDPEAGYFATWMGANHAPRRGLLSLTVSPSSIVGEFLGSTATSDFADRFVIGGGAGGG